MSRIPALRAITTSGQAATVEGRLVDIFTASHVVAVHDALSPTNQARFAGMGLDRMVEMTWKLLKKG
jgi:hypothetical protein